MAASAVKLWATLNYMGQGGKSTARELGTGWSKSGVGGWRRYSPSWRRRARRRLTRRSTTTRSRARRSRRTPWRDGRSSPATRRLSVRAVPGSPRPAPLPLAVGREAGVPYSPRPAPRATGPEERKDRDGEEDGGGGEGAAEEAVGGTRQVDL